MPPAHGRRSGDSLPFMSCLVTPRCRSEVSKVGGRRRGPRLHLRPRNPAKIRLGARGPHDCPPHRQPGTPGPTEAGGDSGPAVLAPLQAQLLLWGLSGPWLGALTGSPRPPRGSSRSYLSPHPQFAALHSPAWKEIKLLTAVRRGLCVVLLGSGRRAGHRAAWAPRPGQVVGPLWASVSLVRPALHSLCASFRL